MKLFKVQSLLEFTERFKTDLDCEEQLASLKWEKGIDAIGCLTTVSKDPKTEEVLLKSIKYWDNVKIILEEREVEESNWNNKNIGETK